MKDEYHLEEVPIRKTDEIKKKKEAQKKKQKDVWDEEDHKKPIVPSIQQTIRSD